MTVDTAGFHLETFPDIPEAGTYEEAVREAVDPLIAALGDYIPDRREIPQRSRVKRGKVSIILPTLIAATLALCEALCRFDMSRTKLGRSLAISEGAVRRLLDLDHRSHIDHIEAGLQVFDHRLLVDVQAA